MNDRLTRTPPRCAPGTAFASAADAWFWTMMALRSRHDGANGSGGTVARPCEPDDVVRCLDQLYQNRRIGLSHARVLRRWGDRQVAPAPGPLDGEEARLWHEALDQLDAPLRRKGIVGGGDGIPYSQAKS